MSGGDLGFRYRVFKGGEIRITHDGRPATTLRNDSAAEFVDEIAGLEQASVDAQQIMARITGNYRHGNERLARNHPRNR